MSARGQRGQTVVLAAIVMVALLAIVGLVVDAGLFLETRRELQNAADAGALAGISKVPDDFAGGKALAVTFAQKTSDPIAGRLCRSAPTNVATTGTHPLDGGIVYTLTVTSTCQVPYLLGGILGLRSAGVGATATAAIGSPRVMACPLPFGVEDANGPEAGSGIAFGTPVQLQVGDKDHGNSHAMALDGPGGHEYREWLAGKCDANLTIGAKKEMNTQPGAMVGPTRQGLEARGLVDGAGGYEIGCPDSIDRVAPGGVVTHPDSPCLGVVPIVTSWTDVSGRELMAIDGFALVFVVGYDGPPDMHMDAVYVKATVLAPMTQYDPLGLTVTRLMR